MNVILIDPTNESELSRHVVDEDKLYQIYGLLLTALDSNPSCAAFLDAIQPVRAVLGCELEPFNCWVERLQKIKTEIERDDVMCFTLEDWIDTWYIADFVDARFPILKLDRIPAAETTATPGGHFDTALSDPDQSVNSRRDSTLEQNVESGLLLTTETAL